MEESLSPDSELSDKISDLIYCVDGCNGEETNPRRKLFERRGTYKPKDHFNDEMLHDMIWGGTGG